MALGFAPYRDNQRLMNDVIPIDGMKEIFGRDLLQCFRHACRNDEMPEYKRSLSNYTNIPRPWKFRCHDNDTNEWSLDVTGFRDQSSINNSDVVAPLYKDGGKKENKVLPYDDDNKITFVLVEGSVIIIRPPHKYRGKKWMRNLEFRVVLIDEGEAEVVPVVDADADIDADDGVQEAEEAEEEQLEVVPAASRLDEPLVRFP